MADADAWIKGMLAELRERLAAERGNFPEMDLWSQEVPKDPRARARDILALFDTVKEGSVQDHGLICLITDVMREVHGRLIDELIEEVAKEAVQISDEGRTG